MRDGPEPSFEADIGLGGGDAAHDLALGIFNAGQALRHGARTRPIAACRHVLVQCLVRPLKIVDFTPAIEGVLHLGEITKAPEREHLILQRAMEALVLAAALRMIGAAVPDFAAELEQPNGKPRVQRAPEESPQGPPLSTNKASGKP